MGFDESLAAQQKGRGGPEDGGRNERRDGMETKSIRVRKVSTVVCFACGLWVPGCVLGAAVFAARALWHAKRSSSPVTGFGAIGAGMGWKVFLGVRREDEQD